MLLPESSADLALTRIAGTIPVACVFIVITEFCERLAYYGGTSPFQNYVQHNAEAHILNPSVPPGAFDLGSSRATLWNNYFTFIAYSSPLIGAFIADQYWGKFKTIISFSTVYMIGFVLLTVTSIPIAYTSIGVPTFSNYAYPGYIVAITIIGLGTGGIKALVSPLCADQVPKEDFTVVKNGKEFTVDRGLTIQSVYNWFYWSINIGAMVGQIVCTRLEQSAFWKAYLFPSCMFVLAIIVFASGYKRYVHVPPEGSIYAKAMKCILYANKRKKTSKSQIYPPNTSFAFLEYAMPIAGEDPSEAKKRTWTKEFPSELRKGLQACSIFPLMTIYWVAYSQMTNNMISQASEMQVPSWLTDDLINIIDPIVLVILIPVFDQFIYPYINKHKIKFGYIKRITLGIFIGGLSMVWAAVLQVMIYNDPSRISVYWQFPAYVLIAVSEIFASIASLEYSYTHAPASMKGIVSAISLFPNAGASLIGIFISPFSQDPTFTGVYVAAAVGCFVVSLLFFIFFHKFEVEDYELKKAAVHLQLKHTQHQAIEDKKTEMGAEIETISFDR